MSLPFKIDVKAEDLTIQKMRYIEVLNLFCQCDEDIAEFFNGWLEICEMFRRARAPVELNGREWYGFKWYPALISYPDLTPPYGEK